MSLKKKGRPAVVAVTEDTIPTLVSVPTPSKATKPKSIMDAIISVLRAAKEPMHRDVVLGRVRRGDAERAGIARDLPDSAIFSVMYDSRKTTFQQHGDFWSLRKVALVSPTVPTHK